MADPVWRPTAALARVLVLGVLATAAALGTGRADLVAIVGPVMLMAALAVVDRGRGRLPRATATAPPVVLSGAVLPVDIALTGAADLQLVTVTVPGPDGDPMAARITVAAAARQETVWTTAPLWGQRVLARPDLVAAGPDGLWETASQVGAELVTTVLPAGERTAPVTLPPILGGWAGEHRSRRPGQGGDLVDLREYAPGDRLRSIHWRAFARHQRLFVRRTLSDADADFVLVVDTRSEVRPEPGRPETRWGRLAQRWAGRRERLVELVRALFVVPTPVPQEPNAAAVSSLDLTTQAATSIAAAQLAIGDRVGLLDLSSWHRGVRIAAGSRQLQRLRHRLAGLRFTPLPGVVRAELWGLPPSAVVVLFSPLTDDSVVLAAVDCRARGHQVYVIDVLPWRALQAGQAVGRVDRVELAVLAAERAIRLQLLRDKNIPVIDWDRGGVANQLAAIRAAAKDRR